MFLRAHGEQWWQRRTDQFRPIDLSTAEHVAIAQGVIESFFLDYFLGSDDAFANEGVSCPRA